MCTLPIARNSRVQIFFGEMAKLEDIWTGDGRGPCGMYIDTRASQMCYIGELSSAWWCQNAKELWDICNQPGCGPRISLYSLDGTLSSDAARQRAGRRAQPDDCPTRK